MTRYMISLVSATLGKAVPAGAVSDRAGAAWTAPIAANAKQAAAVRDRMWRPVRAAALPERAQ